jgi:hypothetical protein
MPSSNVFANVWFYGTPNAVTLNVVDDDGIVTDLVSRGYLQVSTDGENYKSVNAANSLGEVSYNDMVYISTTPLAQSEGWSITGVTGVSVAANWNGYQFKMPNSAVTVTINMKKDQVLSPLPLSQYTDVTQGSLAFYADAACTHIIAEALPGDTVYVKATVKDGYQMKANSLHVLNAVDATMLESSVSPNVWNFTMPAEGIQPVTCSFEALKYTAKIVLVPGTTEGVKINYGAKSAPVKDGNTIDIEYNTPITVVLDAGQVLSSLKYKVNTDPEVTVTGGTFMVPAAPAGATITVTITVS